MQVIRRKVVWPGVSAIRPQSTASRKPERGRRVVVAFMNTDKVYRIDRGKLEKFSASDLKIFDIPLKNTERVRGEGGSRK